jgi:hypothetical protein
MRPRSHSASSHAEETHVASQTLAAIAVLRLVTESLLHREPSQEAESARMLRALAAAEAPPAPPPGDFLQKLRRKLAQLCSSGRADTLTPKELRYAPWLLWTGTPPAATFPGLLHRLLDQAQNSTPALRRLIGAYLRDFDPRSPGIDEVAASIRRLLSRAGPRFDLWRAAQKEVHLFEPTRGPAALALRLLADENPAESLARYRLDDPITVAGKYMMAVENATCAATPYMLRNQGETGLRRVEQVVAPDGALRFPGNAGQTARAFLRAWLDGGPEPIPTLQPLIRARLLQWLGDPRLPQHRQRWVAAGEQETQFMRRWLTRASLDLFFKLIDQYALDQHWRYRHAFWLAYLGKEAITDAWLALGSQTFSAAGAIRELGAAYGRLKGGTGDQSALLLRIGPLTIGEFSHNGSLRAWLGDSPNAPRLGEPEYRSASLKRQCLPFPANPYWGRGGEATGKGLSHINSAAGYWQGSAATLIERHAGFRLTPIEWRPR